MLIECCAGEDTRRQKIILMLCYHFVFFLSPYVVNSKTMEAIT